jgi:hypothetical protein
MTMLGPNPMRGKEDEYGAPRKGGPGNGGYRSNQSNSSFMHDDDDFEGDDQF